MDARDERRQTGAMNEGETSADAVPDWLAARFPGSRILAVTAGWSEDRKFRVETDAGTLLVRVSPLASYERKREELRQVERLNAVTDALPRAVGHGAVHEADACYLVYGWTSGTDVREALPKLSSEKHYDLGVEAGRVLRRIHGVPQEVRVDAHAALARKVANKRRKMAEQRITFPDYGAMLAFLERHLPFVANAPTVFRHGDFHLGNMLIDEGGGLRVIDLNRSDFGDPWEDFNRMFTFSRQLSPAFARGQIHGYFEGPPPAGFFAHALCYVLIDCAFGLLWATRFGEREIAVQNGLVAQIMEDFDGLRAVDPLWFCAR